MSDAKLEWQCVSTPLSKSGLLCPSWVQPRCIKSGFAFKTGAHANISVMSRAAAYLQFSKPKKWMQLTWHSYEQGPLQLFSLLTVLCVSRPRLQRGFLYSTDGLKNLHLSFRTRKPYSLSFASVRSSIWRCSMSSFPAMRMSLANTVPWGCRFECSPWPSVWLRLVTQLWVGGDWVHDEERGTDLYTY